MDASSLVYDTTLEDLRSFTSFERQWLFFHVLSGVSFACMNLSGTALLWTTPCASAARQELLSLSKATQENTSNWVLAIFVATTVFSSRTGCLQPKTGLELPPWTLILSQTIFALGAADFGTAAYFYSGPWYTLSLLRLQTGFTASVIVGACNRAKLT